MKTAIASGKGGTGKTTVSVNLASYLSSVKKIKTVLADVDVEEPNSGIFLKGELQDSQIKYKKIPEWIQTQCTFCGKCREYCNFNAIVSLPETIMIIPELCHSCFACSELCPAGALPMKDINMGKINLCKINEHLHFVEGITDIGQESAVPLIKETKIYAEQIKDTEITIYDAPPGTSCPVIETVKDVDFVLLVTEPTPFGLHDLKLALETLEQLNKEFAVIINRYGIGNDDVEEYCNKNKINIIAKIPYKKEIAEAYSKGELLYEKFSEVNVQMDNILNSLLLKKRTGL
jgi:MinD superfamily P-loop ATPase